MTRIEKLKDKVFDLEMELGTKLEEIEEHSINMNILLKDLKEMNESAYENGNNDEVDFACSNLSFINKMEKIISELKF